MKELFFELIRVAIGTQNSLSRLPASNEWDELFEIAKKQSLVGITFLGLRRLGADPVGGFATIGISEKTYLTWMAKASKIQVQNEMVSQQCGVVQRNLSADGFGCCILKGQGLAQLYDEPLRGFRQSGDIDVWVWPKDKTLWTHSERARCILEYMRGMAEVSHPTYHNASWKVFSDTEVEVHYTPSWMYTPWRNRRLQRWFEEFKSLIVQELNGFKTPSVEFNMVYVLQHIYRHLFGEGIGLRQVMDYYFVLRAKGSKGSRVQEDQILKTIESLGLKRFAAGMMWIMQEVFGLEKNYLLMEPDAKEGRFLLSEMMLAGNFGKYDERIDRGEKGLWGGFVMHVRRNLHFIGHYPSEVLWCPLWKVWHQLWLRKINNKITYNSL